jgi:hypothetical protein
MTQSIDTTYTPTVDHAAAATTPEAVEAKKPGEAFREAVSGIELGPAQSSGAIVISDSVFNILNGQSNGFLLPLSLTLEGQRYWGLGRSTGSLDLDKKVGLWWKPSGTGALNIHRDPITNEPTDIGPYTTGSFTNTLALGIPWSQANMIFSVAPVGWTTSYDLNSDYVTCATTDENCTGAKQYIFKNGWTLGGSANWYMGGIENPTMSNLSFSYYYTTPEFEQVWRENSPSMEKHKTDVKALFPFPWEKLEDDLFIHGNAGLEVGIHEQDNPEDNSHAISFGGGATGRLWGMEAGKAGGALRVDISGKVDPASNEEALGQGAMHSNQFSANIYLGLDTRKKDGQFPIGAVSSYFNLMNLVINPYYQQTTGSFLQDSCLYTNNAGDLEIRDACGSETWDESRLVMPGTLGIDYTQHKVGLKARYGMPLTPAAWATGNKTQRAFSGLQLEITGEVSHTETHLEGEGIAVNQELPADKNNFSAGVGFRLPF